MRMKSLAFALALLLPAGSASAQKSPPAKSKPLSSFADIKVDTKTLVPRKGGVTFGEVKFPIALDTPHFIIAGSPKVRPAVVTVMADACERLRTQIDAELPLVPAKLGTRKCLILLCEDGEQAAALQKWVTSNTQDRYAGMSNWFRTGCTSFSMPEELQNSLGVIDTCRLFNLASFKAGDINRPAWSVRIHFVTSLLFREALSDVRDDGRFTVSRMLLGYNYYREWRACGKIETEVSYTGTGSSVEIFKKSKGWHAAVKKLLEDGVAPTLEVVLAGEASKAHPRDAGFFFAFMCFVHATPERLAAFNTALAKADANKKAPDPESFAKDMGFESAAAFEKEWTAFIRGPDFR